MGHRQDSTSASESEFQGFFDIRLSQTSALSTCLIEPDDLFLSQPFAMLRFLDLSIIKKISSIARVY